MENANEFIALLEKYESITIDDIKSAYVMGSSFFTAKRLTGYGSSKTCTLCRAVRFDCTKCVFKKQLGCQTGELEESYLAIGAAKSGVEMLAAYKNRLNTLKAYAIKKKIKLNKQL